ncbi:MAG: penicillin acylase family protein [Saprospiraceae bacterium]
MVKRIPAVAIALALSFLSTAQEKWTVPGLQQEVEILVDQWGIPHIYAKTEEDLFFAQGYYAAKDRLFQFEIWRRQATGTVAELLGPRELKRDIGSRLFRFRGDMARELQHYHPRGQAIITAFVKGINAYIQKTRNEPGLLPEEFRLLGITPGFWTPEIVVSRHQGLLGNSKEELSIARAVALLGPEKVVELSWFHPNHPDLSMDTLIHRELLAKDLLEPYNAFRRPLQFRPEDLVAANLRNSGEAYHALALEAEQQWEAEQRIGKEIIGSNNWIVSGKHTQSAYPMLANDPHRALSAPSLRYMAHLVAPGWNVIGGGEPTIPGISIGHNEHGAWGLTIFSTDAEDLLVYETHPDNPDLYRYNGKWEKMEVVYDTIFVKGAAPERVALRYTRHGPVVFQDKEMKRACAVRCGWLEIGGSPYLASLRMNQCKTWEEFRQACQYSHIPGENMIWADKTGQIGWQAVGITPIRRNWSGLVPVPGDGRYEWDGYLPIQERPHLLNPEAGYLATANENVTPPGYPYPEALGYSWSDPYRGDRASEFLSSGRKFSLMDMAQLQTDYLSLAARQLSPLLKGLKSDTPIVEKARLLLLGWDHRLERESAAAALYHAWENALRDLLTERIIPAPARPYLDLQLKQVVDLLVLPDGRLGTDPLKSRDNILLEALAKAAAQMTQKLGKDMATWQYGNYKYALIKHPLSDALSETQRKSFDVGPLPRGGNAGTVNNTGNGANQTHGATFRLILDTADWDHALATNSPGQSGDVRHPHYRNLFEIWANDRYFPMFYSLKKIESVLFAKIALTPAR